MRSRLAAHTSRRLLLCSCWGARRQIASSQAGRVCRQLGDAAARGATRAARQCVPATPPSRCVCMRLRACRSRRGHKTRTHHTTRTPLRQPDHAHPHKARAGTRAPRRASRTVHINPIHSPKCPVSDCWALKTANHTARKVAARLPAVCTRITTPRCQPAKARLLIRQQLWPLAARLQHTSNATPPAALFFFLDHAAHAHVHERKKHWRKQSANASMPQSLRPWRGAAPPSTTITSSPSAIRTSRAQHLRASRSAAPSVRTSTLGRHTRPAGSALTHLQKPIAR